MIEVVVAFVVLALVLSTSFQLFSTGLARTGELDNYSRALVIAQSQLAQASVGEAFQEGETGGESGDRKFRWSVSVTRYEEGADPNQQPVTPFQLYRVGVRVTWPGSGTQERGVDLATLVIGKRA